jgi:hypothetical protein
MKAYLAAAAVFSAFFVAFPALSQGIQYVCQNFANQNVNVAGRIDSARVEGGVAIYVVNQADAPCFTKLFSVEDPSGQIRCHEGQRIVTSGTLNATDGKAWVSGSNYSCQ